MAPSRPQGRRRTTLLALGLAAIFIWLFSHYRSHSDKHSSHVSAVAHGEFWRQFQPLLIQWGPGCDPPERLAKADSVGFDPQNTEQPPNLTVMPDEDVLKMKHAHRKFVHAIAKEPPALAYQPGTRGIVSTAGGSYLPVLVISLRMLRQTGSELPMEVFLADWDEYDGYICQVVLPSLNAKCVLLSEILDTVPDSKTKIEKYQYKPFAMLFSSFEEILFLDADAFPLQKPEQAFTSEPFTSKGLITWPDFWGPTASPLYYTISGQERPPPNIRQSTESGEVFISKRSHLQTLLLVAYYNYWGPGYYYPLLSQGAAGEGDKETFLAAATVLDEPFYQVSEPIRALGRHTNDGFAGSTMVQYSPMEDYALTKKGEWRIKGARVPPPKPFFVHINFPKFNPATVFAENGPVLKEDGSYTLAWTAPEEVIESFGPDLQRRLWGEIRWTACALEGKSISWKGQTGICEKVDDYWNTIFR
ncbi:alpha-1,2-mannosyltransferase (Mnn2) [Aspergillus nomiae NRRL 13137]|uniref:Alpha-1,2-mannosyltransferase (Mnn2) n=1 Tax=Aspergillus nomiae NRRL (strain ATCC 15546 / NRRL 13137 / CBS 260.88 / M93) TaxID=1509407 RepID=A0A0L1J2W4_ASPN3|nr:alpha-1,2-mannosyltransferase (Mnn2) [Aspergillus nomiae NRRL 13137]KNG86077.1 alpha-1,2-mannosyltransferase (Mnn2) [Aspergillus nomiae NRRL 13137]